MKIYVSPLIFSDELSVFRKPMEKSCGMLCDDRLFVGEMIIDYEDGKKTYLSLDGNLRSDEDARALIGA